MLHSGRVAFGEMDEAVFGGPAPGWSGRPEQSRKHVGGCLPRATVLGVPMTPRDVLGTLTHLLLQGIYRRLLFS